MQPLNEVIYRLRGCRIFHFRYQQALHRCMLQYSLRISEDGTGRGWDQWVTGTFDAQGRTRRAWKKLQRSVPGHILAGHSSGFALFSYITDLDMLVQVFPFDRQLSALGYLATDLPAELEPLLLERFGPGGWHTHTWDIQSVRYVAELRATQRSTMRARNAATSRMGEKSFYTKIYKDREEGERTFRMLRTLSEENGAEQEGFGVPRPVAYLNSLRTLVQEEASGLSIQDIMLRGDETVPGVRKTARALATLHLGEVRAPRRHRLQDEIALLRKNACLVAMTRPHLGPEIEKIIDAVTSGLEEVPPSPIHGDPNLEHILLDGERLFLLDLDRFAEADPVLDTARVVAGFTTMPHEFSFPRDRARAAAQIFAEEYFLHVPGSWRTRFPLHYAGAILKSAGGGLRNRDPAWSEKLGALVEEARRSVAGEIW